MGNARITQVGAEAVYVAANKVRLTQVGLEAVYVTPNDLHLTQVGLEVVYREGGGAVLQYAQVIG